MFTSALLPGPPPTGPHFCVLPDSREVHRASPLWPPLGPRPQLGAAGQPLTLFSPVLSAPQKPLGSQETTPSTRLSAGSPDQSQGQGEAPGDTAGAWASITCVGAQMGSWPPAQPGGAAEDVCVCVCACVCLCYSAVQVRWHAVANQIKSPREMLPPHNDRRFKSQVLHLDPAPCHWPRKGEGPCAWTPAPRGCVHLGREPADKTFAL